MTSLKGLVQNLNADGALGNRNRKCCRGDFLELYPIHPMALTGFLMSGNWDVRFEAVQYGTSANRFRSCWHFDRDHSHWSRGRSCLTGLGAVTGMKWLEFAQNMRACE